MDNNETVKHLDNVLQYLHDSYNGYMENQEQVSDVHLKDIFSRLCQQRLTMIDQIKSKIHELGGEPTEHRTVAGTLHQWYQAIKNAITGGDPASISRQIKFGENFLIECYKNAINEDLPFDIKQQLQQQLAQIEEGVKEVDLASVE